MPQATPGKADLIASVVAHPVQRAVLAAFAVELAGDRMVRTDEEVVERKLVAGGAAQPDRVPDVGPFDVFGAHQHGAFDLLAIGVTARCAVGGIDRAVGAEPGGVASAGGKRPDPGDAVAAFALDRLDLRAGTPGEHRAWVGKHLLRNRQVEIGGRHRTAAGLAQAPRRRGIALRNGLNDMEEGDGIGLDPVGRPRQQQAEQPRLMQPVEQVGWQAARHLDIVGGGCNRVPDRLGASDHVAVARKVGGSHAHIRLPQARRIVADAATSAVALSSLSICSIDLPRVSSPKNR